MRKLELLLSEPYFVPVLRDCNNVLPPQIGQPFTPTDPPVSIDLVNYKTHTHDYNNRYTYKRVEEGKSSYAAF